MSFVGWRVWRIFDWQDAVLGAAFLPWAWEGPTMRVPDCDILTLPTGGGFHAFKSRDDADAYQAGRQRQCAEGNTFHSYPAGVLADIRYSPVLDYSFRRSWVLGRVRLYGTVIEYERGYRASHAIVDALEVAQLWGPEFMARLAARYGCEVTPTFSARPEAPPPPPPPTTWRNVVWRILGGS